MDPTVDQLAKEKGLVSYDTALPKRWCDDVLQRTGVWPGLVGFVWCYDKARIFGEPVPLTKTAEELLARYELASV